MKQFILPKPPDHTGMIRLSGRDYHYLARVRRFKVGTVFKALLPNGEAVQIAVRSIEKDCILGVCLDFHNLEEDCSGSPKLPPILLFQGLPKISKMDLIVRQAVEGGITEIVPFTSEYSPVKLIDGLDEKRDRWLRIIKEARQQSGSKIATSIRSPGTVQTALYHWETLTRRYSQATGIFLHQTPLEKGSFHGYLNRVPDIVGITIGPEGGFSSEEAAQFLSVGFKPLVLEGTVLRTETAALYAAAAVRIILLENESWTLKIP
ncbi:MAG: 16S rRNA (uracil(1498)-N(3))-methyltransferase [Treponema sp.]|jgi:16S rRNA (uracil1498-N3)-methyltransferase|nr:16S rRNA (uracil(1498)-N(3))-methyltransferase [Treponema sp.]